ncbi:MAG: ComEC/Rec2 family competence protein [Salinimicrobium sp.]
MKLLNTPIVKLTVLLLCGIIFGSFLELPLELLFLVPFILLLIFFFVWKRAGTLFSDNVPFGIFTALLFFVMGISIAGLHQPQAQSKHYIHHISSETAEKAAPLLLVRITNVLKPDLYSEKAIAEVQHFNHTNSEGKLLLLLPKEGSKMSFLEGQQILFRGELQEIPKPKNPHQFDYQIFMAKRNVLRQVRLLPGTFKPLSQKKPGMETIAAGFRKTIVQKLQENGFSKDELATVQALLLGQKQDISAEVYNNFAAAGVIHILAVSGLHVGIILLILNRLFSPLDRFKKGKILKAFLVILLLWSFAILSGLSPSVVRAVSMFSFLAVGMQLKRRGSSLISVFASLLFLLLIKPQWIFEVGFQLSYTAVLGILLLQAPIYGLWRPKIKILRLFWGIFTGTLAAQAAVLPLSLYYFHQFPGLFFVSNLVILPLLGFLLGFGILVILLALLQILPQVLADALRGSIELLNNFVAFMARQEQFFFRDIPFSFSELVFFYLLIIALTALIYSYSYKRLLLLFSVVIALQLLYFYKASEADTRLVIFHNTKQSIIGFQKGQNLRLFHQKEIASEETWLNNFRVGEDLQQLEQHQMKNVYFENGKLLVVIDSSGIFPQQQLPQEPYLLLTGSPKVNLDRVIDRLKPQEIIAGGHNFGSYIKRWEQTVKDREIPFFSTLEKGAFVLE